MQIIHLRILFEKVVYAVRQGFEPYQRVLITRRRAFKGVGTGVHEMAKQELI